MRLTRKARKSKAVTEQPVLVPPHDKGGKTGCLACPLLVWSKDFDNFADRYARTADVVERIRSKEPDGHTVRTRCVQEAFTPVDILCVGETPGGNEDRAGKLFMGQAGTLLREVLKEVVPHVSPERVGYANTVACRPPRNRKPGKTEVTCCAGRLWGEIRQRKPKVLVALGNIPLEALTGVSGITTYNNAVLECTVEEFSHIPVVACLHPAYILRMDHQLDAFATALETAGKLVDGSYEAKAGMGEYHVVDDVEALTALVDALIEDGKRGVAFAFDTETGSLSPFDTKYPQLLCFSFSNEAGTGYTVPFDHRDSPWTTFHGYPKGRRAGERQEVEKQLRRLFTADVPRIAQNEKFDRNHIRKALGIDLPVTTRDTYITHYIVDERPGTHGLDKLAYTYTGMGGYDRPLEEYKKRHPEADPRRKHNPGSYANIPGHILFPYAAADADCTIRVDSALQAEEELTSNEKLRALALTFLPKVSRTLARMEWNGAKLDPKKVAELDAKYSADKESARKEIAELPEVRKYVADRRAKGKKFAKFEFNPGSTQQLQEVLFERLGFEPVELTDKGLEILALRWSKAAAKAKKENKPEPSFQKTIDQAKHRKEWGFFSTKKEVLHDLNARYENPVLKKILEYRLADTLYGTFVVPMRERVDEGWCLHGTFKPAHTQTGRLASENPNLQNIPNKGGGLIKQAYVSRFGNDGVVLQLDYSQIELRVAACWYEEPTMMRAYRDGLDLHAITAADLAGLSLEDYYELPADDQKQWRLRAKRINFGILYSAGPPGIMRALRQDGVKITHEEAKELLSSYWDVRPKLKRAIQKQEDRTKRDGYLEAFSGRRRRIPEVFSENRDVLARALRQAGNFPIQCGASEMTLLSLVAIDDFIERERLESKMTLTVHDSLKIDSHVDEVFYLAENAAAIMENVHKLSDDYWPGLDWSWLTVPLKADAEIGVNWGQMVEFDPHNYDVDKVWDAMLKKASLK